MAGIGPYYCYDFARVCSAELRHAKLLHAELLHVELLHAEMDGGMVSEVEACQSPKRSYMSPEEFHEFGKDADIWLGATPTRPLDDVAIFTEEVKAVAAFRNREFISWFD